MISAFIEAAKFLDPSQTLDGVSILKNLRDPDKTPHQRRCIGIIHWIVLTFLVSLVVRFKRTPGN